MCVYFPDIVGKCAAKLMNHGSYKDVCRNTPFDICHMRTRYIFSLFHKKLHLFLAYHFINSLHLHLLLL